MVFAELVAAVPFYKDLTLEEVGGRGVRWQERDEAGPLPSDELAPPAPIWEKTFAWRKKSPRPPLGRRPPAPTAPCASAPTARSGPRPRSRSPPPSSSPIARQQAELSPEDARRLGIINGETIEVGQNGTKLEAKAAVRSGVPEGTIFLATGIAVGFRERADRARGGGAEAVSVLADVNFYEPWWVQIIKSLVIFGVIFAILPVLIVYERKLLGRFQGRYGPNRVGPYRAVAAARGDPQVRHQGALAAGHERRLPVPDRADDRDPDRGRGAGADPLRGRPDTSSASASASTGSTSRSARCTCSRSPGSRSTGSCSAAGRRAPSTRSSAPCAAPRS